MTAVDALILDFVQWVAEVPQRPYSEVMAAWRTSCPRLTVWEDSIDAGYVARFDGGGSEQAVHVTPAGRALLAAHGR
jgi:hypothetical protein